MTHYNVIGIVIIDNVATILTTCILMVANEVDYFIVYYIVVLCL